jgi:hypothetical protein
MNVKELREALDAFDDEEEVLLSSDAEGNGYSKLDYSEGVLLDEDMQGELTVRVDLHPTNAILLVPEHQRIDGW